MLSLKQKSKILNLCLAFPTFFLSLCNLCCSLVHSRADLGRSPCCILTAHQADACIQQQASRLPGFMATKSGPGNKRRVSGTITNLPDELLSQILRHVDFVVKLQGHEVCHQWNEVLKNPCRADLWGEIDWKKMKSTPLKDERRRQILQSTDWLARRAAGISHVKFETRHSCELTAPQNSEARFFMEMQLPSTGSLAPPWEADQHCSVHRSDPCKPWHSYQRQKMPCSTQIA